MADAPLTPAAARQRQFRERRREGVRCMRGDVPADVVRALVRSDWLASDEADDPRQLGAALIDLADCWMTGTLKLPKP